MYLMQSRRLLKSTILFLLVLLVLDLFGCGVSKSIPSQPLPISSAPLSTSLKTIAVIKVGAGPKAIALDPVARRAYVVYHWTYPGWVRVLNTRTEAHLGSIPVGLVPMGVALDSTLHRAYIVNGDISTNQWTLFNRNSVSVIDTRTSKVITTLRVIRGPLCIAIDVAAHRAYVLSAGRPNSRGNTVGIASVINTVTDTVIGTLRVGINPISIALDPGLHRAFVLQGWNGVRVVSLTPSLHISSSIPLANDEYTDIAVDPIAHRAYVVNRGRLVPIPGVDPVDATVARFIGKLTPGTISVLDTSQSPPKDIATVNVETAPGAIAVDQITHRIYITSGESDTVKVIGSVSQYLHHDHARSKNQPFS